MELILTKIFVEHFTTIIATMIGGVCTYLFQQIYVTRISIKNRNDLNIAFNKIREIEKKIAKDKEE